jgi:hypothetical protein
MQVPLRRFLELQSSSSRPLSSKWRRTPSQRQDHPRLSSSLDTLSPTTCSPSPGPRRPGGVHPRSSLVSVSVRFHKHPLTFRRASRARPFLDRLPLRFHPVRRHEGVQARRRYRSTLPTRQEHGSYEQGELSVSRRPDRFLTARALPVSPCPYVKVRP